MGSWCGFVYYALWPISILRFGASGTLPKNKSCRLYNSKVWKKKIQFLKKVLKILSDATTRDGRVSDTTTRLVQKLLNLNPHQRLKAHQVVAVLDSTIATSHLSSSSTERSLLQVCVKFVKLFMYLI